MSLKIYVYGKCSTCQNALRFLEKSNLAFIQKEITLTPPTLAELKQMLVFVDGDVKKIFNTSGLLYKEMQLSSKFPPLDEALTLLTQHGMLVKRPFLLGAHFGLLGFKEDQWIKSFLSKKI